MAAFSYQHHPSLLDSVLVPSTPVKNMPGFLDEGSINTTCFSQFYTTTPDYHPLLEIPPDVRFHEGSQFDDHSTKADLSDNGHSVTKKQTTESSTVVDKLESGEQVTQKVALMNKKRKNTNGSSLSSAQSKDAIEEKNRKKKKCNGKMKEKKTKAEKKVPEESPTGYIHVRARRGQATDSHSLAERVRREKISERMKILQRLVPGCDKVTGKALMLDEIINYVQSLQNQVEFLSMKLASVNPFFYDFGADQDALVVRPERLSSMASPLPSLQQCSPIQPTVFADADYSTTTTTTTITTFATANNYPVIDGSSALLLQGQRRSYDFNQNSGGLFWDAEDQRQKILIPPGVGHNLCSFH